MLDDQVRAGWGAPRGPDWQVAFTESTLSGHVSCQDRPTVNEEEGTTGTVDVELDFVANS